MFEHIQKEVENFYFINLNNTKQNVIQAKIFNDASSRKPQKLLNEVI